MSARLAVVHAGVNGDVLDIRPIETPLFEQAAVFERGIGEVTDVVEKELFRIAPRTEDAEAWAAQIGGPAYALDDQSALRVVDGAAQVISEGEWRAFP